MSGDQLLQDGQPMWGKAPVPKWAYSQDGLKRTQKFVDADTLINIVAKPAWKYAYYANIFLWSFAVAYPGLVWWASVCDGHNFAKAPPWLWTIYVLPLASAMYCEVKGHRLLLPAVIKVLGPYKLCAFEVPFIAWFVGVMGISIGSHADLATSGFFLGRLLKTESCSESWVHKIFPNLTKLGVFFWVLMFTQLLRGLVLGIPRKCESLKELLDTEDAYDARETAAYYRPMKSRFYRGATANYEGESSLNLESFDDHQAFLNVGREHRAVSDLLVPLSDSGRMVLISFRNTSYIKIGFEDMIRRHAVTRTSVGRASSALAHRVLVNLVFESSFMANLQGDALAVSYVATRELDAETMVSLAFTFALTAYNVYSAARTMIMYNSLVRPRLGGDVEDKTTRARLNRSVVVFVIACILCAVSTGYAITKIWIAFMFCKDAVWTIPQGCLNIHKLLSPLNSTDHAP